MKFSLSFIVCTGSEKVYFEAEKQCFRVEHKMQEHGQVWLMYGLAILPLIEELLAAE